MAIDTVAKRSSVQSYTFGLTRPPADGTIGEADRAACAWFYSGLTYGEPVIPALIGKVRGMILRIGRMMG